MNKPDLKTTGLNVKDFGAMGDGLHDDHQAVQDALNAGSPLVVIPFGTFKIGNTIKINSNTTLLIHPKARLFFGDNCGVGSGSFLITNSDKDNGNENIYITGGIFDGNNAKNTRGADVPNSNTGVLIEFFNVRNLTLKSIVLRNPVSYHARFCKLQDFVIEDVKMENNGVRPNQDGLHFGGYCFDGVIRNIRAVGIACPSDDLIALNADDANYRAQNIGKINGPIKRIRISSLYAEDCHSFVRLLSVFNEIEDITIEGIEGGFNVNAFNLDAARYCMVPVIGRDDERFYKPLGLVKNINISNVNVFKNTDGGQFIRLETRADNFNMEDFRINEEKNAGVNSKVIQLRYLDNCNITIDGVGENQIEDILENSSLVSIEISKKLTPYQAFSYSLSANIDANSNLTLNQGGFKKLSILPERT